MPVLHYISYIKPFLTIVVVIFAPLVAIWSVSWAQDSASNANEKVVIEFSLQPAGKPPNPVSIAGAIFIAHDNGDFPTIREYGPNRERAYIFPDRGVTIVFPRSVSGLTLRTCIFAGPIEVTARAANGKTKETSHISRENHCGDSSLLFASEVNMITIAGGQNEAGVVRISGIVHCTWAPTGPLRQPGSVLQLRQPRHSGSMVRKYGHRLGVGLLPPRRFRSSPVTEIIFRNLAPSRISTEVSLARRRDAPAAGVQSTPTKVRPARRRTYLLNQSIAAVRPRLGLRRQGHRK